MVLFSLSIAGCSKDPQPVKQVLIDNPVEVYKPTTCIVPKVTTYIPMDKSYPDKVMMMTKAISDLADANEVYKK